ncbi:LysM peptidoglycan-binding domain-containing protein [Arthrobacter castelli]|uniref:LysM peptidoglycan-binding domain-containing protein n=1 Tax=Arthrobacter castelli TaxID=271431 RepID=UPI0003F9851B|nr:LysM peptidoglycan-binding domain-containing protein [Arthrobacter castelli]
MVPNLIWLRQPQQHDLVGNDFVIAGHGATFESLIYIPSVEWDVLDGHGNTLGSGRVTDVGSLSRISDFTNTVSLSGPTIRGAEVMLRLYGYIPLDLDPPGTDVNIVRVTLFSNLIAFRLYEVESGDTLSAIAASQGHNTTVDDIVKANPDRIHDPDLIYPGQVFRIPLLS